VFLIEGGPKGPGLINLKRRVAVAVVLSSSSSAVPFHDGFKQLSETKLFNYTYIKPTAKISQILERLRSSMFSNFLLNLLIFDK
jgi:hypothetical protein